MFHVNNYSLVPPVESFLGSVGIELEKLEEYIDKLIIVEHAVYTSPLVLRADRKSRLFWSHP